MFLRPTNVLNLSFTWKTKQKGDTRNPYACINLFKCKNVVQNSSQYTHEKFNETARYSQQWTNNSNINEKSG
jgi:hypothetical protein